LISKNDLVKAQKETLDSQVSNLEKKEKWLPNADQEIETLQKEILDLQN
jgi:hypothetical protein